MSSTKADHCLAGETGLQTPCVILKKPKKREELLAAQADGLYSLGSAAWCGSMSVPWHGGWWGGWFCRTLL